MIRHGRTLALSLVAFAVVGLGACGGDDLADPDTSPPEATTTAPTTAPSTTAPIPATSNVPPEDTVPPTDPGTGDPDAGEMLTEAEDGGTFSGAPGEELPLRLSSDWAWEEPVVEGGAVVLTPVNYLMDPGYFEWIIEMVDPGTAEIAATGTPNCDDPTVCPDRTVGFTIVVED